MRVVTWNMNKRKVGNWEWLLEELDPDIALVQEAGPLPRGVKAIVRTFKKTNRTAIYSKLKSQERLKLHHDNGMGLLVARIGDLFCLNVYANLDFKPVYPSLLGYIATYVSVARHRLKFNHLLIAGDFNMDRRMDENPTSSRFAAKGTYPTNGFFDAILDLGFLECMKKFSSVPVQTHYHNRSNFPWELDHMFATQALYEKLNSIQVVSAKGLSDHNPIVADFGLPFSQKKGGQVSTFDNSLEQEQTGKKGSSLQ